MRSPRKCSASNTPNRNAWKAGSVCDSGITEDGTFKGGFAGTARISTIFEGDEEEDADKSSLLSGAIWYDSEAVYLRSTIASTSFAMLPNFVTDSSGRFDARRYFHCPIHRHNRDYNGSGKQRMTAVAEHRCSAPEATRSGRRAFSRSGCLHHSPR